MSRFTQQDALWQNKMTKGSKVASCALEYEERCDEAQRSQQNELLVCALKYAGHTAQRTPSLRGACPVGVVYRQNSLRGLEQSE
jgi:hypothetical protein